MDISLSDYLNLQWVHIQPLVIEQVELIALVMVLATLLGVGLGMLIWSRSAVSGLVIGGAS
ncbi:MAG: hypothetical protein HHJ13_06985 [Phycicoccus sp.]|nr:hypothetical protein [Phycicoccus sp.]